VLWNGLYLEAQLEDFFLDLAERQPVVALAERLPVERLLAHADYPGKFDPHVWMDVDLWSGLAAELALVLAEQDPEGAETFAANAEGYEAALPSSTPISAPASPASRKTPGS
jgi:manganese/zinc/iron transport system substrate-binding protein